MTKKSKSTRANRLAAETQQSAIPAAGYQFEKILDRIEKANRKRAEVESTSDEEPSDHEPSDVQPSDQELSDEDHHREGRGEEDVHPREPVPVPGPSGKSLSSELDVCIDIGS